MFASAIRTSGMRDKLSELQSRESLSPGPVSRRAGELPAADRHFRECGRPVQAVLSVENFPTLNASMRLLLSSLVCATVSGACTSSTGPEGFPTPAQAQVVTSDIPAFWNAFDQIKSISDTMPIRGYLTDGSIGLKDFTELRWKTAKALTEAVWVRRAYYASIRSTTLAVAQMEPHIRAAFSVADTLIDDAIFPNVYLAIGAMSTGGTTSNHGLLIGVELFSLAPDSPMDVLTPWQRSVVRTNEVLPAIVAHELVHYQQRYGSGKTLLGQALREGIADFIGRILSGRTINEAVEAYGLANETQLWSEFKQEMGGTDVSKWLYNGGTVTATSTRPADLGYFIGARIAAAYHAKAVNKHQAIQDMLRITDFNAFLAASGYNP
jgi:hypothetical protein